MGGLLRQSRAGHRRHDRGLGGPRHVHQTHAALPGDEVHVVVMEKAIGAQTSNQGGDSLFINRFALRGVDAPFDTAEAMRTSLAHQNPLHVVALPRDQSGSLTTPTGSLLSVSSDQVVVTAFKPAEDPGQGFVVRVWELGDQPQTFNIDVSAMGANSAWHTTLVETDIAQATVTDGVISAAATANEIITYRFVNLRPTVRIRRGGRRLRP